MTDEPLPQEPGELVPIESPLVLGLQGDPASILAQAHIAAKALMDVVAQKPKKVIFGGEQYLEFEDWMTLARFYGLTVKTTSTRYVEYGPVHGWEASAEVVHLASGRVVSTGEAMCLDDEEKWSSRPKYAYAYVLKSGTMSIEEPADRSQIQWEENPDKPGKNRPVRKRVPAGEEKVPLFQLRSMAQTRACAKAFRTALAWVAVLAGFKPTPAEEMDGVTSGGRAEAPVPPAERAAQPPPAGPDVGDGDNMPAFGAQSDPARRAASVREPGDEDGPDFGLAPPEPPKPTPIERGPNGEFWIGQQGQVIVTQVQRFSGTGKNGKPYLKFAVNFGKLQASTFDKKFGELAEVLMARKVPVQAELRPGTGQYQNHYDLSSISEWCAV